MEKPINLFTILSGKVRDNILNGCVVIHELDKAYLGLNKKIDRYMHRKHSYRLLIINKLLEGMTWPFSDEEMLRVLDVSLGYMEKDEVEFNPHLIEDATKYAKVCVIHERMFRVWNE